MRLTRYAAAAAASALLIATVFAEQGVLVLQVATTAGAPIPRVIVSTKGDGAVGPPTDVAGRTRIRLAAQTKPQAIVGLTIVSAPKDLVFISPWDNQIRIPPFENESQNFAAVVLAERGDRALLENGKALLSMVAKVNLNAGAKAATEAKAADRRGLALNQVATAFGLEPAEVDAALRAWSGQVAAPYEMGMASLYADRLPEAEERLGAALLAKERRLEQNQRETSDAAFFLGQALYEQGKYGASVEAYRKALAYRPGDPATMNNLGLSLSQAGDYASAEPFFQQAIFATELARGKGDPDLAFALSNLGVLLVIKGQLDAAEPVLRRGLAIREASLGPRDLRTASSLTDVGSVLLRRGDDAGAEPLLLRARQIFDGAGSGVPVPPMRPGEPRMTVTAGLLGRPGLAAVLLNLSTLELHRGRADAGKTLADQVLRMQTQAVGPRHPEVASALTILGNAEVAAKDYLNATAHFTQAIDIFQTALGDTHPALVDPLGGLADAVAAQQNDAKAAEALRRAIVIRQSHFGAADPVAADLVARLAKLQ
jgi:tetratricopeptide (TPR) repeat protein